MRGRDCLAAKIDALAAKGEELPALAGVPVGIKDVLTMQGAPATAGSLILKGYLPPYEATAVTKLEAAGAVLLGMELRGGRWYARPTAVLHRTCGAPGSGWNCGRLICRGPHADSASVVSIGIAAAVHEHQCDRNDGAEDDVDIGDDVRVHGDVGRDEDAGHDACP